ncbi:MAG: transglycosylase SLT domain-containing protein [Flavobacteriaceae bacterium]
MTTIKNKLFYILILFWVCSTMTAQESMVEDVDLIEMPEMSPLDSIKKNFVSYDKVAKIDNLWLKELASASEISPDSTMRIDSLNLEEEVVFDLPVELLKERLKKLDEQSPFDIEYNPALENVIKSFLKNRKKTYERLMALSEYYFPLFEEKLAQYHIPLELKYLAIVESALNPRAISRMGASGLWQFMLPTGRAYNLSVNSYVDERYDPIKATEAACQYLSALHTMYGDWDLALAAYNAGPGNVNKAIRRSGGKTNYWNIRRNLPRETQGYLPAFLATMYIFEYHKEHNIQPQRSHIARIETDTVMVKKQMSFAQISELLEVTTEELKFLNPSYKLDIVPYVSDRPHYLRLPLDKVGLFVANEEAIYAYIDIENSKKEKVIPFVEQAVTTRYHTIRRGDTLSGIARRYGVSVNNLKKWNNLRSSNIRAGQKLKVM